MHRLWKLFVLYLATAGLLSHLILAALLGSFAMFGTSATLSVMKSTARAGISTAAEVTDKVAIAIGLRDPPIITAVTQDAFTYLPDALPPKAGLGQGRILRVGREREFKKPSDAAKVAEDGDIVAIDPGTYLDDSAIWRANNLTLRGDNGIAKLDATGHQLIQHKAIWVIKGDNVLVENIAFTGAKSRDLNGAGIRAEGKRLHIRRSFFHDNEEGILAGRIKGAQYLIEHCEFARNGHQGGQAHQIYVGDIDSLEVRFSYFHGTVVGSAIKSRASQTKILYNRIVDGRNGSSNYSLDLSGGGRVLIQGNIIQQGTKTGNHTLVSYASEQNFWRRNSAFIVHNTLVSDRHTSTFVKNHHDGFINVYNNLLIGRGVPLEGPGVMAGNAWMGGSELPDDMATTFGGLPGSVNNIRIDEVEIADRLQLDYRLKVASQVLDTAVKLTEVDGEPLAPAYEYVHPSTYKKRQIYGSAADPGALEYVR